MEPIIPSQAIPYLKELGKKGIDFTLLTFEKKPFHRKEIQKNKKKLKEWGIEWKYLPYHGRPKGISTAMDIFRGTLYSIYLILRNGIQIIHIRGVTVGIMMPLVSKIFKVKLIFDMRGLLAEEYVGGGIWKENQMQFKLVKMIEKFLLKSSDAIVVLTEKHHRMNKNLIYLSGKSLNMEVIPCCVDMKKFDYSHVDRPNLSEHNDLSGKFIFLYSGKVGTWYLIPEMLDFFVFAKNHIQNSKFVILTQDNPEQLFTIIKKKNIDSKNIEILKPFFEEIPNLLSHASAGIFFINSRNKFGSSPIKLGEFLASGVPVIINPGIGDTEELVRENKVGVVVEHFDVAFFEKALQELLELKKESEQLRERCRQTAKRFLSLELGVDRYWKIYQKLGT